MVDLAGVIAAATFAADKHRVQRRKNDAETPYINHPLAVANCLANEGGVHDGVTLMAALLHDVVEDTKTKPAELEARFGAEVRQVVEEVTDDKRLSSVSRKRQQIEKATGLSYRAKLIKLADKTCNLRDMAVAPPQGWSTSRVNDYYDWCKAVVDSMRGTHAGMESLFDAAFAARPATLDIKE